LDKVIYTAFTKGYDTLKEPSIITPGWRYICYTDDLSVRSKVWEIVYCPHLSIREIRKIKIIPPFKYNICIWIDGSIAINCNLDKFIALYHEKDFTLMNHPDRNCVYDEAKACVKYKKDDPKIIQQQINYYDSLNYPPNHGMVATGLIIRNESSMIKRFCELWFEQILKFSKRDQLSFNFIANKEGLQYRLIPFSILKKEFLLQKHSKK